MKTTKYTKEQVNEAIYKVITHTYKKDCPEAHEIVKEAGYTFNRCNGYEVHNPETHRMVYTFVPEHCYRGRLWFSHYKRSLELSENTKKFDFVGCLDKEYNKVYWNEVNCCAYGWDEKSPAVRKYEKIRSDLRMAKSYKADIDRAMQKIAELQKDIVRYTEYACKYEQSAKELRKEYGLA